MTRLAICRKCKKIFFTNIRGKYGLRCPQRDCRSYDIVTWNAKVINELGSEILYDIFPKPLAPRSKKRPRKKTPMKSPKYLFCYHANYCTDPKKNLKDNSRNCSNEDREKCYNKAKKKYQSMKAA